MPPPKQKLTEFGCSALLCGSLNNDYTASMRVDVAAIRSFQSHHPEPDVGINGEMITTVDAVMCMMYLRGPAPSPLTELEER